MLRPFLPGNAGLRTTCVPSRIEKMSLTETVSITPDRPRRSLSYAALAALLLVGWTASAEAQMGGRGRRQHDEPQQTSKQPSAPKGPVVIPEVWPRLDEGAVLCKTRDDLTRYQRQMAGATPGETAGCHAIKKQTGIQILDHDGISRTQVVTTDDAKETGWTNAYLPSTPPPSIIKGTTAAK